MTKNLKMNKVWRTFTKLLISLPLWGGLGWGLLFTACSEEEDLNAYDPYTNWEERNTAWFSLMVDSAKNEITKAKSQYGEQWAEHCEWRLCHDLSLDHATQRTDTIVMRYVKHGDGMRPCSNDTVFVSYRGWLMPANYRIDGRDTTYCQLFDQSFYGSYGAYATHPYDESTATPIRSAANVFVTGFSSALQNMHAGDQAHIYFPCNQGYGTSDSGKIPGGSTLHFFIHLAGAYPVGETAPTWK